MGSMINTAFLYCWIFITQLHFVCLFVSIKKKKRGFSRAVVSTGFRIGTPYLLLYSLGLNFKTSTLDIRQANARAVLYAMIGLGGG